MKVNYFLLTIMAICLLFISCSKKEIHISLHDLKNLKLFEYGIERTATTDYIPSYVKYAYINYDNKSKIKTSLSYHLYSYDQNDNETFYKKKDDLNINPNWDAVQFGFYLPEIPGKYKILILKNNKPVIERIFYIIDYNREISVDDLKYADSIYDDYTNNINNKKYFSNNVYKNGILWIALEIYRNVGSEDESPLIDYKTASLMQKLLYQSTLEYVKARYERSIKHTDVSNVLYFYSNEGLANWYYDNYFKSIIENDNETAKYYLDKAKIYFNEALQCRNLYIDYNRIKIIRNILNR